MSIAEDESRHAAYLLEAMERRFSAIITQKTLEQWRTRKVNALFAMFGNLMEKGGTPYSLVEDIESKPKSVATEKQLASGVTV